MKSNFLIILYLYYFYLIIRINNITYASQLEVRGSLWRSKHNYHLFNRSDEGNRRVNKVLIITNITYNNVLSYKMFYLNAMINKFFNYLFYKIFIS